MLRKIPTGVSIGQGKSESLICHDVMVPSFKTVILTYFMPEMIVVC
jgi:hypothetical protein